MREPALYRHFFKIQIHVIALEVIPCYHQLLIQGRTLDDGNRSVKSLILGFDPQRSAATGRFVIGLEQIVVAPVRTRAALSGFRLLATSADSAYAIQWQSARGRTYSVYVSYDLANGWEAEPVAVLEGTGEQLEYRPSQTGPAMFFKVSVRLSDDY